MELSADDGRQHHDHDAALPSHPSPHAPSVGKLMNYFMIFVLMMGVSFIVSLQHYHQDATLRDVKQNLDHSPPPQQHQQQRRQWQPQTQTQQTQIQQMQRLASASASSLELLRQIKSNATAATAEGSAVTAATQFDDDEEKKIRGKRQPINGMERLKDLTSLNKKRGEEEKEEEKEKEKEDDTKPADKDQKRSKDPKQRMKKDDTKPADKDQKRSKDPKQRMNVVLFYADDWTMKVLGKLDPNQIVQTPNIDKMAANGMIFTNNCVTTSVCWVSRSTLSTGTYSAIHKHTMPFSEAVFETEHWNDTLYPKMKNTKTGGGYDDNDDDAGYYTGLVGKWHKLEKSKELKQAFHESILYYGHHWVDRDGQKRHVTDLNQDDAIKFVHNWNTRRQDKRKEEQQQRSERQLRRHPASSVNNNNTENENEEGVYQPFFLTVSFFATHAVDGEIPSYQPKNATRFATYPDWSTEVPVPKTATELHYQQLPRFLVNNGNEGRTRWRNRFEPHNYQSNIKDMYSLATEVDTAIGAIIQTLQDLQENVYENTVLIFTTDNGNMHGEHGLAEKWYPFEESIRVPLVIQDPRMPQHRRGTTNEAWTLSVDLPTTILGIANIAPAPFMQGRDIADLYLDDVVQHDDDDEQRQTQTTRITKAEEDKDHRGMVVLSNDELREKVNWRKDWFYEFNLGKNNNGMDHPWKSFIDASFALVTDEWKYVVWPQHNNYEQLFHRSIDPYDEWDLLAKLLRNTTNDGSTNANNDDIQTTEHIYKQMKERYREMKELAQSGGKI